MTTVCLGFGFRLCASETHPPRYACNDDTRVTRLVFIFSEVRDSRVGYLVPVRDGPWACHWDAVASCHFHIQVDHSGQETIFGVLLLVLGCAVRYLRMETGFYTELRYKSCEHSGLAWETILDQVTK